MLLLWMRTTVGVILAGLTFAGTVASATELRVGIQQDAKTVRVGASGNAVVTDGSGRTLGTLPPMLGFVAQAQGGASPTAHVPGTGVVGASDGQ